MTDRLALRRGYRSTTLAFLLIVWRATIDDGYYARLDWNHPNEAGKSMAEIPNPPALNFDHAEGSAGPAMCGTCSLALGPQYYMVNGAATCSACHARVVADFNRGHGAQRAFQAFSAGTIAAALGAALYFGVAAITGYEIGIVALVLGLMVGGAVRMGSGGRGGWFYQLLAILLTYLSLGTAYGTMVFRELSLHPEQYPEMVDDSIATGASLENSNSAATESQPASAPGEAKSQPEDLTLVGFVVTLGFLIVSLPVLIGTEAPITFLFLGIALYEAWRLNRGRALQVSGPYVVSERPDTSGGAPLRG